MYIRLIQDQDTIGTITYLISQERETIHLTISHISTGTKVRGKGYGYFLMTMALYDAFSRGYLQQIQTIEVELDDMSDRFQKNNNLYRHMGFQYVSKGYPEMMLKLSYRSFHPYFRSMIKRMKGKGLSIESISSMIMTMQSEEEEDMRKTQQYLDEYKSFFLS